ncbi:hypothetical protein RN001_009813 [Aquatica leii]|uniref:Epimerase family protein SDR39U1 n=1 Tax=Aquatica leii TaxID=1421715 RepID=A0AAN7SE30_9COLE|nr:hypothetical protein RN001_009813 [Aquatica leii]
MPVGRGTVLIGGGTGFIGTHLCKLLQSKNYDVKIISRMPGAKHMTWHDLEKYGIPSGTQAVVNLAGQNVLDPMKRWTAGFKQNVWNSRIRTTMSLTEAIINTRERPKAYVTISGVGIYKPSTSVEYSEDHQQEEFDFFSKLCIAWENSAKLPENVLDCRQVTIRSGVVLGKNGGMIKQLYIPFYLGVGGPIGNGEQYLPWIHIDDISRLILFAIETDGLKGKLNGVAPQVITNKEFTNSFASALWRPAVIPLPKSIVNFIFSEERAKMITEGQKVIPKRTQAVGFNYVFPDINSACEELVQS